MSTQNFLQSSINAANRQITALNRQIDRARERNEALDAKIQQLQNAKQHAEWAGFNADQLKQCLYQVQPGEWAGTNWDRFRDATHGGDAYSRVNELHRSCDTLRDEIQAEIDKANAQKDYFAEIIGSARDSIAALGSSIAGFRDQLSRLG